MIEEPLVTIVTPTYQRAKLLERTLRSVASQEYRNIEHVVVDGGSSDGTADLLKRWERDHDLRWVSEPDRGMYEAINKGLRMARGDIVAYLNSDDRYFPWAVTVAVETLTQRPDVDFVYGHVIRQDDSRGIVVPVFQPHFIPSAIMRFGSLLQPTVFFRRRALDDLGGFDESLRYVADNDFWLRAVRNHRFHRVDEFLAYELFHDESLSKTREAEMAAEDLNVRRLHQPWLRGGLVPRAVAELVWQGAMSVRWLSFALSTKTRAAGWHRSRLGLAPTVEWRTLVAGIVPARGARRRAGVRWGFEPSQVAEQPMEGSAP